MPEIKYDLILSFNFQLLIQVRPVITCTLCAYITNLHIITLFTLQLAVGHEIPSINLDNLLIQIRVQVTPKWCNFGEAVGIDKNVLDNFAKHCSPEECVVEMLDYWLRSCTKQPTWNDVAKILDAIGLPQLAFKVSTTSN